MDLNYSINSLALANCAVFLGSIVQTSTGMGFAMVAVPLLALINLAYVPGPVLFVNIFLAIFMLKDGRSQIVRYEITTLLPMIIVGSALGVLVLLKIPSDSVSVLFSILILCAVLLSLISNTKKITRYGLIFGGISAGLMGTTSGIPGPPLAVLYQNEKIQKTRATLALVFLFAYISSLSGITIAGGFDLLLAFTGLLLLPGLILGFLIGKKYRDLLPKSIARTGMLSIASIGAIILLIKSM